MNLVDYTLELGTNANIKDNLSRWTIDKGIPRFSSKFNGRAAEQMFPNSPHKTPKHKNDLAQTRVLRINATLFGYCMETKFPSSNMYTRSRFHLFYKKKTPFSKYSRNFKNVFISNTPDKIYG